MEGSSYLIGLGIAAIVGAALIVLAALGHLPRTGRTLAIVFAAMSLGIAALAGGAYAQAQLIPDHHLAMERCVDLTTDDYPGLSHGDAKREARKACEQQLADHPDSFDWMWLT